jgi:hypothetical protein
MQQRRRSRAEVWLLIGVPLAWAVLLLFHPTGDGDDFYPVVADETTAWLIVHVGTLIFVPAMAAVIYLLLRDVDGAAARVARIALVPFLIFYTAFEVLVGIGTGLFVEQVKDLPAAERADSIEVIEDFTGSGLIQIFELLGTGSFLIAMIATGIALRGAGAPVAVTALLILAAIPIAWHVPPFGQFGLAIFIVAVVLVVRGPRRAAGQAAAGFTAGLPL